MFVSTEVPSLVYAGLPVWATEGPFLLPKSCYYDAMVVRMRHTRSHTKNRRSHHALSKPALSKDESGNAHLRHRASAVTGSYRGRKVLDLSAKLDRSAAKATSAANAR